LAFAFVSDFFGALHWLYSVHSFKIHEHKLNDVAVTLEPVSADRQMEGVEQS
jgi:hypothetical protein